MAYEGPLNGTIGKVLHTNYSDEAGAFVALIDALVGCASISGEVPDGAFLLAGAGQRRAWWSWTWLDTGGRDVGLHRAARLVAARIDADAAIIAEIACGPQGSEELRIVHENAAGLVEQYVYTMEKRRGSWKVTEDSTRSLRHALVLNGAGAPRPSV